ncbi:SBBP repeat-containing protein [Laspinema olomoucense]|uniref:DUF7948 domain-containing protein n=1 Tax=Laspinema olomoucense TaxID=3231600 RepID=UPI0021BAED3E|nr:SBBP repeat-containing protein [Laspinema sp. D3d]MCT7973780.1 SBBP repeat-containing protein [Laspinema sp. D3d]
MDNLVPESDWDLTPTIHSTLVPFDHQLASLQNPQGLGEKPVSLSLPADAIPASLGNLPLSFIANVGQLDPEVEFLVQGAQHDIFFTPDEIVLSKSQVIDDETISHQVKVSFADANPDPTIEAIAPLPGVANFITGDDPSQWHENIPTYQGIAYQNLYDGIDLIYRGDEGELKSEFIVNPGVDPGQIRMNYTGGDRLNIREDGALVIETPFGELVESAPYLYQDINGERVTVSGAYQLYNNAQVGFTIGEYDRSHPLAIDPTLEYTTYLGGSQFDSARDISVDEAGNIYLIGDVSSPDFPTTGNLAVPGKAFISKLSNNGTLLYTTFLGGNGFNQGEGIATDNAGNAYVTGVTLSNDFPILNAIQGNSSLSHQAFIAKLSNTGSLVYSTLFGGSVFDAARSIAADNNGNVYVTGETTSADFPILNAIQPAYGGTQNNFSLTLGDAFAVKLSSEGQLVYSTYLGGNNDDGGLGIATDGNGNAYITGATYSNNFPIQNGLQSTFGGVQDAFITKLGGDGNLVYSTYIGGTGSELGESIAVDTNQNVYITGTVNAPLLPVIDPLPAAPAIADRTFSDPSATLLSPENGSPRTFSFSPPINPFEENLGDSQSAFVTKLANDGSRLIYSLLFGGSNNNGTGIAVDNSGNFYVTGTTNSDNFFKVNAFQGYSGQGDAFVTKFSANGSVEYSTYLGGTAEDTSIGIEVDNAGTVYVAGNTYSPDLPNSLNRFGGNFNAFVAKITPQPGPRVGLPFINLIDAFSTSNGGAILIGSPLGNVLFDESFYLATNPAVAEAVTSGVFPNGFEHFFSFGQFEGRQPSPFYNEGRYLAQNPDVAAAVAAGAIRSGFEHFRNFGLLEGRDRRTQLFHEGYYLNTYPDIAAAVAGNLNNLGFSHYIQFGQREGRNPNRFFNEGFYRTIYPDVAAAISAGSLASGFEHFAFAGEKEGRQPSPLFNEQFYRATYPDIDAAVAAGNFPSGFDHFLRFGAREGRAGVG